MKPTLVILAAGLGSRYGDLKQMDGMGPGGSTILEYTIFDAIRAGFGKVVFVIRESMEQSFRESVISRVTGAVEVDYVFQELHMMPEGCTVPEGREKPWGTAHAVWCAREAVQEPFAMVNADDFYGKGALQAMGDFLKKAEPDKVSAALTGYRLENTLSDHGSVSRGICEIDESGNLVAVEERTAIARNEAGDIFYHEQDTTHTLSGNELVSMNLIGFTPAVFGLMESGFIDFYTQRKGELKAEYYIAEVLKDIIKKGSSVPVLPTRAKWFGVTYKEDRPLVKEQLQNLVDQGEYPALLWS